MSYQPAASLQYCPERLHGSESDRAFSRTKSVLFTLRVVRRRLGEMLVKSLMAPARLLRSDEIGIGASGLLAKRECYMWTDFRNGGSLNV